MISEFRTCIKNPKYSVNSTGQVIGPRRKLLKGFIHPQGYKHYFLGNGDCSKAHRLVAQAFIPNPENKPEVNHINGDKLDNRVENLEWVTHLENMQHARRTGLQVLPSGEQSRRAILSQAQVDEIRQTYIKRHTQYGQTGLGKKFGVTNSCIWRIINGNNWMTS